MSHPKGQQARVSQGGEGRIRHVTPEEGQRLLLASLREGRCDIARQAGWDLCVEAEVTPLRDAAAAANQAMRDYNRNGLSWLELDAIFARLEATIARLDAVSGTAAASR